MHTFAPAGTRLAYRLDRNDRGRDLVDRGPDSFDAKDWIAGPEPSTRFDLVLRGNHEQMMLEALLEGPPRRRRMWDENAWSLWEMNGGG